jgi:hypothetical protein
VLVRSCCYSDEAQFWGGRTLGSCLDTYTSYTGGIIRVFTYLIFHYGVRVFFEYMSPFDPSLGQVVQDTRSNKKVQSSASVTNSCVPDTPAKPNEALPIRNPEWYYLTTAESECTLLSYKPCFLWVLVN